MGTIEKMLTALGTVNHITVYFTPEQREAARQALDRAENYLNDMDDRLSVFKADSEISQINDHAGICDVSVSAETFELLRLSKELGGKTDGAFDITTKPLTDAKTGRVDYRDVLLNPGRFSVRLRHQGQGIHLGGIAKGYAADRIAAMLIENGIDCAAINLGGTVRHIGQSRRTGIRNPFAPKEIIAVLDSVNETVVTSGLYERGSHIFDPRSGMPAETDLLSVTVVGNDGAAADAAATACMVLGAEKSAALLSSLKLEGIFILKNGGIFTTKKIRPRVNIFE